MQYSRDINCECSHYKDLQSLNFEDRLKAKQYWSNGYIYDNNESWECECHKKYRLTERFNRLANKKSFSNYEEFKDYTYLGDIDNFAKLEKLPQLISSHNLKDVLMFIDGPVGCQKTTSVLRFMYELFIKDFTVDYYNFGNLINDFSQKNIDESELLDLDWLIIDDCFESTSVNFKAPYLQFYNLILKRRKPTIIISTFDKKTLLERKDSNNYNFDMLEKMFLKIEKYNTVLHFNDCPAKLQLGKNIDIWSL